MSIRERLEEIISEAQRILAYDDEILSTDDNELDRACDILSDLCQAIDERLDPRSREEKMFDIKAQLQDIKSSLRAQGVDPDKLISDAGL